MALDRSSWQRSSASTSHASSTTRTRVSHEIRPCFRRARCRRAPARLRTLEPVEILAHSSEELRGACDGLEQFVAVRGSRGRAETRREGVFSSWVTASRKARCDWLSRISSTSFTQSQTRPSMHRTERRDAPSTKSTVIEGATIPGSRRISVVAPDEDLPADRQGEHEQHRDDPDEQGGLRSMNDAACCSYESRRLWSRGPESMPRIQTSDRTRSTGPSPGP